MYTTFSSLTDLESFEVPGAGRLQVVGRLARWRARLAPKDPCPEFLAAVASCCRRPPACVARRWCSTWASPLPRPRCLMMSPRSANSASAWRTTLRETPNSACISSSVGSGIPGMGSRASIRQQWSAPACTGGQRLGRARRLLLLVDCRRAQPSHQEPRARSVPSGCGWLHMGRSPAASSVEVHETDFHRSALT